MFRLGSIFTLSLLLAVFVDAQKFPADIEQCKYSDSDCLRRVSTDILRTKHKGHSGLNIVSIDPLHVDSIVLEKIPGSAVNVEFKFTDIKINGINQGTVKKLTGFTKEASDLVFEMSVQYPKFDMTSPYTCEGNILNLPIEGQGNSVITFHDTLVTQKGKCTTRKENGKVYLMMTEASLDIQPKKVHFAFDNLFNGVKSRGENMNKLINDNWETVFAELKPLLAREFAKVGSRVANGIFSNIPYSDLFLQSD